jgi:hypothetical protein
VSFHHGALLLKALNGLVDDILCLSDEGPADNKPWSELVWSRQWSIIWYGTSDLFCVSRLTWLFLLGKKELPEDFLLSSC